MTRKPARTSLAKALAAQAAEIASSRPSGMTPSEEEEALRLAQERRDLRLAIGIQEREAAREAAERQAREDARRQAEFAGGAGAAEPASGKRKPGRPKGSKPHPREKVDRKDWVAIRSQYVHGVVNEDGVRVWPTFGDLAQMWAIPMRTIITTANRQDWSKARKQFETELSELAEKRAREIISDFATDFEKKVVTVAQAAVGRAARFLADGDLSPHEFQAAMGGLRQAVSIARTSMGQPDQITITRQSQGPDNASAISSADLAAALVDANQRLAAAEASSAPDPEPTED